MASKQRSYSNADLDRFKDSRASRPSDMEVLQEIPREGVPTYSNEPSVEALLAAAKGTLGRADKFQTDLMRQVGAETGDMGVGPLPLGAGNVAKGVVELLNPLGGGFDLGDQASGLEQAGANVLPFLTGGGVQGTIGAGKLAARGGKAVLAALRGLATKPAAAGVATLAKGAPAATQVLHGADAMADATTRAQAAANAAARTKSTHTVQSVANPNELVDAARQISSQTGYGVGPTLRAQTRGGVGSPSSAALTRLAGAGDDLRWADELAGASREADNMVRNSSFGSGGIMPGPMPTELEGLSRAQLAAEVLRRGGRR